MKWYIQYNGDTGIITGQVQSIRPPVYIYQIELDTPIDIARSRIDLKTLEILPYDPPDVVQDIDEKYE